MQLIWGADDAWQVAGWAHKLHGAIPGSHLTILENCGHFAPEDQPDQIATLILEFVGDCTAEATLNVVQALEALTRPPGGDVAGASSVPLARGLEQTFARAGNCCDAAWFRAIRGGRSTRPVKARAINHTQRSGSLDAPVAKATTTTTAPIGGEPTGKFFRRSRSPRT